MKHENCTHLKELMEVQMPAVEKAIERNGYYLGEIAHHYIGKDEAQSDFFTNHVLPYWGEIFKTLFCTYKCPERGNCKIEERYHAIAETFKEEVERLGIDEILKGEDATEAIFTRYREITQSEQS